LINNIGSSTSSTKPTALLPRPRGGAGLALAIAKQIVELHSGSIWVESTPGKGSAFQMELPARAQFHNKTP